MVANWLQCRRRSPSATQGHHVSCFRSVQVQKKLSDKDRRLVQTNMLVGVAPELIGNTADEIVAISTGRDHFVVQGVLRSGGTFVWP